MNKNIKNKIIILIFFIILLCLSGCNQNSSVLHKDNQRKDSYRSESLIIENEITTTDKVEIFLQEQVPEIDKYAEYITKESNGEANLTIRINTTAIDIYKDGEGTTYLGKYYGVYVGEQWSDHSVMWDQFYVSINFDGILWEDTVRAKESEFGMYTLEEWRNSVYYRKEICDSK